LSPNGSALTYTDQNPSQSVYSYDLKSDTETKMATGYTGSLWLTNSALLVVKSGPCTQSSQCLSSWTVAGPAFIIDTANGRASATNITSMDSSQDTDTWPH
jgi:hypothetical protein